MAFLLTSTLEILPATADIPSGNEAEETIRVEKPEDLAPVPTVDLVTIYNRLVPSAPVKKFKDRQTANERLFKLMQSDADKPEDTSNPGWNLGQDSSPDTATETADTSSKEDDVAATATKKRKKKGAKGSPANGNKRGRAPGYAGAKLYRVDEDNPCRAGGLRAESWELVKPQGITYEKFLEKGGRAQELAFNVRQGRIKVEFPKGKDKTSGAEE